MPGQRQQNNLAISSLVCGIVSIPMLCLCYLGVPLGIVAVVLGAIGRKKANEELGGEGAGPALAGIITGAVSIGLAAVAIGFSLFSNSFSLL